MSRILISTTNTLDNAEIVKYYGIVTTNVVLGVNFFSDFAATFTDIFGGQSDTYQGKLDTIYKEVVKGLESKAQRFNANAIVGLHLDFDEISGKGKQMFMATAIGTACTVKYHENIDSSSDNEEAPMGNVTHAQIEHLFLSRKYQYDLENKAWLPQEKDWEYILSHDMPELAQLLTQKMFGITLSSDWENTWPKFKNYIVKLPRERAIEVLYPYLKKYTNDLLPVLKENSLFDARQVLKLIEDGEFYLATRVLEIPKEYYNYKDLEEMEQIITTFDNLPDKGRYDKIMVGVFTKSEEEVYICPNGHKNSVGAEFCTSSNCDLNIKGLSSAQVKRINEFKEKVAILKELLKQ